MEIINKNYTYNDEGFQKPISVDFLLGRSNCYMYYLTNTQGAESADEAKRLAKLFSSAPKLLSVLTQFVNSLSHLEKNNISGKLMKEAKQIINNL